MDTQLICRHFDAMGARAKFRLLETRRTRDRDPYRIDVQQDKHGEFFDIAHSERVPALSILQVRRKERHLLLLTPDKQRFLCGHDERHWFVAAVPTAVSTVRDARVALLPTTVAIVAKQLSVAEVQTRRNAVFVRQGEWFFTLEAVSVKPNLILKNEPLLRRAGSKPHICQEVYRIGGNLVYVIRGQVYTEAQYARRKQANSAFDASGVQTFRQNAAVYARGSVRHQDHATIWLQDWHRVSINAEPVSSTVGFLD